MTLLNIAPINYDDGRTFVGAGSLCKLTANTFNGKLTDNTEPALFASFDVMPIGYAKRAGFKCIANDNTIVLSYQSTNEPAPTVATMTTVTTNDEH